jgi:hypothetical protein
MTLDIMICTEVERESDNNNKQRFCDRFLMSVYSIFFCLLLRLGRFDVRFCLVGWREKGIIMMFLVFTFSVDCCGCGIRLWCVLCFVYCVLCIVFCVLWLIVVSWGLGATVGWLYQGMVLG